MNLPKYLLYLAVESINIILVANDSTCMMAKQMPFSEDPKELAHIFGNGKAVTLVSTGIQVNDYVEIKPGSANWYGSCIQFFCHPMDV